MSEITRNPLCWPNNLPRRAPFQRARPQFQSRSVAAATSFLLEEINRLNNRRWDYRDESVIISSNLRLKQDGNPHGTQPDPADSGVAVYFTLVYRQSGKPVEMTVARANDKWIRAADNLYAIAYDIELDRAKFRYGSSNVAQSYRGYLAMPEKCGAPAWWDLLGVNPQASALEIKDRWRELVKLKHPDVGGDHAGWLLLQEAFDQAMGRFR